MSFFIVKDENAGYYYAPRKGIYRKTTNILREGIEVYGAGKDGFGLLRSNRTHIVCSNRNNDIIYIRYPDKPYLLIPGNNGIVPRDFTLTQSERGIHMLYKTSFSGKEFLFHCILGKSQKPVVLASLSSECSDYYCEKNMLYYTSEQNNLCKINLSDGKESIICKDGFMPCSCNGNVVYRKNNSIYINSHIAAEDEFCQSPVIFSANGADYIQWRSGDYIKYRRCENNIWSDTVQCIASTSSPHIIRITDEQAVFSIYGYNGRPSVHI